jgi:hypothetical protein
MFDPVAESGEYNENARSGVKEFDADAFILDAIIIGNTK